MMFGVSVKCHVSVNNLMRYIKSYINKTILMLYIIIHLNINN